MSSILVINAAGRETRVALVENGHIAEFYLERKKDKGVVGNIYKGRVVRVLPGMQAAFVDIGLEKAAFLYVSDVYYDPEFSRAQFELTEGEQDDAPEVPDSAEGEGDQESMLDASPEGTPRTITGEYPAVGQPEAAATDEASAQPGTGQSAGGTVEAAAEARPVAASGGTGTEASAATEAARPNPSVEPQAAPGLSPFQSPAPTEATQTTAEAPSAAAGTAPAGAASPTGSEIVAEAIAESVPVVAGAEVVAAALAEGPAAEARGERRGPRDQASRERHHRGREDRSKREEEKPKNRKTARIEDLLKVGQEVLVQISKDPIGTKGARLTSHISIPGRHLVFMPTVDHVGISRRIANEKERRRLREIVDRMRPAGTGFIVRTVAENVPQEKLESDIRFLIEVWNETVRRNEKRGGPGLMHPDLDLILRATRDLFAQDVESLVIDDRDEYERVVGFVTAQDPALKNRVLLHDSEEPIFDAYGIEQEINRAVQRKVWLKSGGYLIFDQAEALTAIDVNSGRYVGKKSLEETITKINVEAAREIVYQLRLRNIGGIIICDFIDMEKSQNRDKVFKTLQEALGRDKAKTNVLRISELGLVEMTRKRVRESIGRTLHEDCSYCDGQGFVKTNTTVCYEIFRELRREAPGYQDSTLVVNCSTDVAAMLQGDERLELRHLMDRYNKTIQVRVQGGYHREQYDIYGRSAQGSEHKVASSAETFEPTNYGAPKRSSSEPRSDRPERGRDRGGRDRNRGGGGGSGGGGGGHNRDGSRQGQDRNRGGQGGRGPGGSKERGPASSPPGAPVDRPASSDAGPAPEPPATVGGE